MYNYHINFKHDHKEDSESDNGEFEKIDEKEKKEEKEEKEEEETKGIYFKSTKKGKLIKKRIKRLIILNMLEIYMIMKIC